jgi:hypothetical protein
MKTWKGLRLLLWKPVTCTSKHIKTDAKRYISLSGLLVFMINPSFIIAKISFKTIHIKYMRRNHADIWTGKVENSRRSTTFETAAVGLVAPTMAPFISSVWKSKRSLNSEHLAGSGLRCLHSAGTHDRPLYWTSTVSLTDWNNCIRKHTNRTWKRFSSLS